jgi:predicted O-methyltransferase YrrM
MMHHIRPWKLFELVEARPSFERIVQMKIPIRRVTKFADYSLRLLELMSMIALDRIVKATNIFEIGTFCGNTTLHLGLNSPWDTNIFTLDADEATLERAGLAELYEWRKQFPLEFLGEFEGQGVQPQERIERLFGNSMAFDFSRWLDVVDLVLIDGDHSWAAVESDTYNAMRMLRPGAGAIAWHDYSNPDTLDNTAYLEKLAETKDLFHIEETMLVVYFGDDAIAERIRRMN